MSKYFHSVELEADLCCGCTNCLKHCPTEAIRVHGGKAKILSERCIDCGECIRICPHHAKKAHSSTDFSSVIGLYSPLLYKSPSIVSESTTVG